VQAEIGSDIEGYAIDKNVKYDGRKRKATDQTTETFLPLLLLAEYPCVATGTDKCTFIF
jgi:hypothetical protein